MTYCFEMYSGSYTSIQQHQTCILHGKFKRVLECASFSHSCSLAFCLEKKNLLTVFKKSFILYTQYIQEQFEDFFEFLPDLSKSTPLPVKGISQFENYKVLKTQKLFCHSSLNDYYSQLLQNTLKQHLTLKIKSFITRTRSFIRKQTSFKICPCFVIGILRLIGDLMKHRKNMKFLIKK